MRQLIVVLVFALFASIAPVASASAGPPGDAPTVVRKAKSSKSKSKDSKSKKKSHKKGDSKKKGSSGTVTLDSISSVKHGKSGFAITASASKADLTCDLKIKYADGSSDHPESVTSDKDKTC